MRVRWLLLLVSALGACSTYREDLNRGQRLYEQNDFERALSIWRYLEVDMDSLGANDQARYAYLRGMTDYRLAGGKGGRDQSYRAHARHWLAISRAIEQAHPGGLSEQWKALLEDALEDLNRQMYGVPDDVPLALPGPAVAASGQATTAPVESPPAPPSLGESFTGSFSAAVPSAGAPASAGSAPGPGMAAPPR
jgi:hypothetical protein